VRGSRRRNLLSMKGIVFLVVIGLVLIVGPVAAQPLAVERNQMADAIWMVPTATQGHFIGYYAAVHLDEPNRGEYSFDSASIGKGRCERTRKKNSVMTSCFFTAWVGGKASESFTMDPLMQSAALELKAKGKTHRVTWAGGDELGFYQASEGCMSEDDEEPREGHGGGLLRLAKATGHIFGEHLVTKGPFSAWLMSGAMVTECTGAQELAGLEPGQSIRITF
jgi:hypothetical protein